jgi:hypothetical protein
LEGSPLMQAENETENEREALGCLMALTGITVCLLLAWVLHRAGVLPPS